MTIVVLEEGFEQEESDEKVQAAIVVRDGVRIAMDIISREAEEPSRLRRAAVGHD